MQSGPSNFPSAVLLRWKLDVIGNYLKDSHIKNNNGFLINRPPSAYKPVKGSIDKWNTEYYTIHTNMIWDII